MTMKAISNGDTIVITRDPRAGFDRTVASYDRDLNTLTMSQGCGKHLEEALGALREYQRERKLPAMPVKVEYW